MVSGLLVLWGLWMAGLFQNGRTSALGIPGYASSLIRGLKYLEDQDPSLCCKLPWNHKSQKPWSLLNKADTSSVLQLLCKLIVSDTPSLKGYGEHTCSRKQHVSKTNAKINFLFKKYCKVGIRSFLSSKGCEKQKPKPELQPPTAKAQFLTYDPLLCLSGKALGTYLSVLFACLKRAAAKLRFYLLKWLHWSTKFHQDSCPVILLFGFIKDELEGKVFYALN